MTASEKTRTDAKAEVLHKIIQAAELEFAERGFDGVGMKALATRADVSQSLLHYHFGSKDKLYAAVIQSRSAMINKERLSHLGAADLSSPDALAQVFRALFQPALGPSGGGRAYARIFAGLIAGNTRDQTLVRENYDVTAKEFIAALQDCLPGVSALQAARIYHCALGVLVTGLARDGRVQRLVGLAEQEVENEELIKTLICFAIGGAKAIQEE
ncbi:MAG: TetR/AcrR family transcriptional regulator [Sulfitobacter sp.]